MAEGAARPVSGPVRLCIGNHDRRAAFPSVFPDHEGPGGFVQGVHDTAAGRCLFLDTCSRKLMPAIIATRGSNGWRRGWPSIRAVPAVHASQPDADPSRADGPDPAARRCRFPRIVGRHRERIRHIFFGHCHLPLAGSLPGCRSRRCAAPTTPAIRRFRRRNAECLRPAGILRRGVLRRGLRHRPHGGVRLRGPIRIEGSPDYKAWDRETMAR